MTTAPTELKPCDLILFDDLIAAYQRGVEWGRINGYEPREVFKAAYDYADKATSPMNTRAPAVGGVRVEPLWMADMLSRNAGNTEGAPAWIRVAQDGEGMRGGFWTCAAATENSPQYIRADLVRKALEPQAVDDAMVERTRLALRPFSDAVFNDNGDLTVDFSAATHDDFVRAHFAYRALQAAKVGE